MKIKIISLVLLLVMVCAFMVSCQNEMDRPVYPEANYVSIENYSSYNLLACYRITPVYCVIHAYSDGTEYVLVCEYDKVNFCIDPKVEIDESIRPLNKKEMIAELEKEHYKIKGNYIYKEILYAGDRWDYSGVLVLRHRDDDACYARIKLER